MVSSLYNLWSRWEDKRYVWKILVNYMRRYSRAAQGTLWIIYCMRGLFLSWHNVVFYTDWIHRQKLGIDFFGVRSSKCQRISSPVVNGIIFMSSTLRRQGSYGLPGRSMSCGTASWKPSQPACGCWMLFMWSFCKKPRFLYCIWLRQQSCGWLQY